MGLIDKLCLWICKGKLKSVVSLDTDWFARADGIARMKGWNVKHMHPLRRIYDEGSEDWISYFEEPMPAGVGKDFSFANKTYLLQIIGEKPLLARTTASATIEESVEKLVRWYMSEYRLSSIEELDMKLMLAGIDVKEVKTYGVMSNT